MQDCSYSIPAACKSSGELLISPVCVWVCVYSVTQSCPTLCDPMGLWPTRLPRLWDFPGKNTGAGCHFLLQGLFLDQESKLCLLHLLHWQVDSLPWATWEALVV